MPPESYEVVREGGGRLDAEHYQGLGRIAISVENATTVTTILLTPTEALRLGRFLINASKTEQSDV